MDDGLLMLGRRSPAAPTPHQPSEGTTDMLFPSGNTPVQDEGGFSLPQLELRSESPRLVLIATTMSLASCKVLSVLWFEKHAHQACVRWQEDCRGAACKGGQQAEESPQGRGCQREAGNYTGIKPHQGAPEGQSADAEASAETGHSFLLGSLARSCCELLNLAES